MDWVKALIYLIAILFGILLMLLTAYWVVLIAFHLAAS